MSSVDALPALPLGLNQSVPFAYYSTELRSTSSAYTPEAGGGQAYINTVGAGMTLNAANSASDYLAYSAGFRAAAPVAIGNWSAAADPALSRRLDVAEQLNSERFEALNAKIDSLRSVLAGALGVAVLDDFDERPAAWSAAASTLRDSDLVDVLNHIADTGETPIYSITQKALAGLGSQLPALRAASARALANVGGLETRVHVAAAADAEQNSYVRSVMQGALRAYDDA